jgi:hypothetical protein
VRGIYVIAAGLYGLNTVVLGTVPFSAAIASHLIADVGGSIPNQRDAGGDDQASRGVSITSLTAVRTIDDAIAAQKST